MPDNAYHAKHKHNAATLAAFHALRVTKHTNRSERPMRLLATPIRKEAKIPAVCGKITSMKHFLLILPLLALTACDSNFNSDPLHRRAVESPNLTNSGNSEVMAVPTGAVPLLTVDLPNTKNDPFVVHTIADAATTMPSTQPSTQPATQRASEPTAPTAASKDDLKVVAQQHPADQFRITRDNEANIDLWVLCPSGIGTVTIERTADTWPATIRLHLRYDTDREFNRLEGFTASELTAAGGKVALKTTSDKNSGRAEVTIPGFAHSQRIQIEWVDAYR